MTLEKPRVNDVLSHTIMCVPIESMWQRPLNDLYVNYFEYNDYLLSIMEH